MNKCRAIGCCHLQGDEGIHFFRFPRDEIRCMQWKQFAEIVADVSAEKCHKNMRLCHFHFEKKFFSSALNRLTRDAIPTIRTADIPSTSSGVVESSRFGEPGEIVYQEMCSNTDDEMDMVPVTLASELYEESQSTSFGEAHVDVAEMNAEHFHSCNQNESKSVQVQTSSHLSFSTPRKTQLRNSIRVMKKRLSDIEKREEENRERTKDLTLADVSEFVDRHCPEAIADFIKFQLTESQKNIKGVRFSNNIKQFALTAYLLGPKCYRFLANFFKLPSISTLQRITRKWPLDAGFNEFIFNAIQLQIRNFSEKNKDCNICFDEMSIKSHLFYNIGKDKIVGFEELFNKRTSSIAEYAFVLMAKGIHSKWKQPIAYFFTNSSTSVLDIKSILIECVRQLTKIGLRVRGVISDLGSNFYKLARKELGVTIEKPYFFVDEKKIFYIFDTPHLLKCTRNHFFDDFLKFDEYTTNKNHLETLYNLDKEKQYRLAPKLSVSHLYPTQFQRMKVKLASQIFSYSVAAAMNTYISFNQITSSAMGTAILIEKMDKLFDILNSNRFDDCKEFNKPFFGTDKQMNFLKEMKIFFSKLTVISQKGKNTSNQMRFVEGWQITISAFLQLWEDLSSEGHSYILTRNINQDCLENYFGQLRNSCGNARNPTPIQLARAFKNTFSIQYFTQSEGTNCLEDTSHILTNIVDADMNSIKILLEVPKHPYTPLQLESNDYTNLSLPEGNCLAYVCGYLVKKCLEKHSCEICKQFSTASNATLTETNVYASFKAYQSTDDKQFGGLHIPPDSFLQSVIRLEQEFVEHFNNLCTTLSVGNQLKAIFSNIQIFHPCDNFPLEYLLSLFTRMRIYYTLKFANRNLKPTSGKKRNPKLVILQNL